MLIDESSSVKQGTKSVGVAAQYCGSVGKTANGQVGVYLGYASRKGYSLIEGQLFMPEKWFEDEQTKQRQECGVPEDLVFKTKPEIGLELLKNAIKRTPLAFSWVAADALYGDSQPVPGQLAINDPSFTSYPPGVEWGVQAIYNIFPAFQMAVGVFNTNPRSAGGAKGGADFALQQGNRGALSIVQVNYLFNHAPQDTGLPGQYSLGGFYDSNKFTSLKDPSVTASGTYGVYGLFQQMVYRDGGSASQKGLTVWGETAIAPKSTVNPMPYFLGAGLSYQGPSPGRDNDIASAGVIYGRFSRYIPRTTADTVIEAGAQRKCLERQIIQ